ncbi:hypothetical protein PAMA_000348 [Pampus argenteus]
MPVFILFCHHASTMRTGVFMESHLSRLVPYVLLLLIHSSLAAPGQPGTQREESVHVRPPSVALANPFGSGEEDRRLLQSYIQSTLKYGEGGPEISSWEQEVFFLFGLYDYDRSGHLDGLEMMKLLNDYNSHHTPGSQANEQVVSMVDLLLQTQDLNQNGLLAPSELLSSSLPHTQDSSNNNASHQEQDAALEEKMSNPSTDQEKAAEQKEETHEEIQVDEQIGQQVPEVPAAERDQAVPVHEGQPEM